MKFSFISFLLIINAVNLGAQNKIRWISWDEALKKMESNPKKLFIDVYIDKCTWCKKLDATTLNQNDIAKYINENFYAVKFDAQYKDPIVFDGQTYNYVKTFKGNYHELAADILQGKLSYPSLVFFDSDLSILQAIPGYQTAEELDLILKFYGENYHKTTSWRKYTKQCTPKDINSRINSVPAHNHRP